MSAKSVLSGFFLIGLLVGHAAALADDGKIVSEEELLSLFETPPTGPTDVGLALGKVSPPSLKPKKITVTPYVMFETGSDRIKGDESIQQLELAGRAFKKAVESGKAGMRVIEIEGHTDNVGSPIANKKLSEARAESVRQYLLKNFGLPQDMLVSKGYGATQPAAPNDVEEGRAKNRRVIFQVVPKAAVQMK